ncbi:MAG: hydroxyacid dehydrogenase [Patescibacteria group bacterium]|nr:hydroxyacid dehydrogenase [Patescibacteria group bacterium]
MKIAFFETEDWEEEHLKGKLAGNEISFSPGKLELENAGEAKDADVVSVFTGSKISAELLNFLPNLKLIATRTTGFDHIDLEATKAKNVAVCSVPSYGENTVAEFAFGLLLNVSRKIYKAFDRIREEGSYNLEGLRGFDLRGKTFGVIGTGRIGQHSIRIANGFGMNVIAFDAYPRNELQEQLNFKYVPFEELLRSSDVITIHVPYLPSTHHLINKNNIGLIKKGAVLINTARGAVVETEALIQALKDKTLGGAGLDVLEEEGPTQDELEFLTSGHPNEANLRTVLENNILVDMENVIITPHNAFNAKEALLRILDTTADNIVKFSGGQPQNVVKA